MNDRGKLGVVARKNLDFNEVLLQWSWSKQDCFVYQFL